MIMNTIDVAAIKKAKKIVREAKQKLALLYSDQGYVVRNCANETPVYVHKTILEKFDLYTQLYKYSTLSKKHNYERNKFIVESTAKGLIIEDE